jgi:predicted house-cleaning noncanonical NTP pyrophosphatase (MazG superfamily)
MTIYNKLVRDKIPEIIKKSGGKASFSYIKDDQEYLRALLGKDIEESKELRENPCLEELADKLEVLYAIGGALGLSPEDIEKARLKKKKERGGFKKRIFLKSS